MRSVKCLTFPDTFMLMVYGPYYVSSCFQVVSFVWSSLLLLSRVPFVSGTVWTPYGTAHTLKRVLEGSVPRDHVGP